MARDFSPTSDPFITVPISAVDTGDWTKAFWINFDTVAVNTIIAVTETAAGFTVCTYLYINTSAKLEAYQVFTTNASAIDNNALTAGTWYCVVACFRDSDKKVRIYRGSLSSPMAEITYATQGTGSGTRTTGGVTLRLGNLAGLLNDFDGRQALATFQAREWTLDEAEKYRLGERPVQDAALTLRAFLPLDSPTASQAENFGSGSNGTVSGSITVAENPPIPHTLSPPVVVIHDAPVGPTTFDAEAIFTAEAFLTASGELLHLYDAEAVFTAEALLTATAELIQAVRPITTKGIRGGIGSGVWQVQIRPRGGAGSPVIVWTDVLGGRASRRLSDISESEITVPNENCATLNEIQPWEHEVHLLRNERTVWIGVPSFPTGDADTTTLLARDLFTWLEHRVIPVTEAFDNTPLSTIFQTIFEDVMDVENSMSLGLDISGTVAVATRLVTEVSRRVASEELNELTRTGLDYTVIGRTIIAGSPSGFPVLPGVLLKEHLEGATWSIVGPKSCSKAYLIGISEAIEGVAGGISEKLGLVEQVISEGRVRDPVSALAAAEEFVLQNRTPQIQITGTLTGNCPWSFEQLIPGVTVDARLTIGIKRIEERMRLTGVDVDFSADEQVMPTFVSERAL